MDGTKGSKIRYYRNLHKVDKIGKYCCGNVDKLGSKAAFEVNTISNQPSIMDILG